jgi:hypothetical protein
MILTVNRDCFAINRFVFVAQAHYISCEVRTEFLKSNLDKFQAYKV